MQNEIEPVPGTQSQTRASAVRLPSFPGLSRVEVLGRGGMGTVFRAWQDDLARPVALKMLRAELCAQPQMRERFAREAHILARLDHPGIVPVHYSGETADGPYYVMRLVEGVGVDRHLAGKSPGEVAAVLRDVAIALSIAHRAGVLHRDVKPDNVLVEPNGRVVLVDFGLSIAGSARGSQHDIAGTIDFLAPEVLSGKAPSEAADIYALGATLYTALTGRVPFAASEPAEKLRAIREDDPPLPRTLRAGVPKPLQAICLKAMERSPADRYASADEFARDLDRFVRGDVVQALPVRSRSLLRRKIELHFADHANWYEQGLLDERQLGALRHAYEQIDEQERGLLRGLFSSVSNLLLFVGILLSVFGPIVLELVTWNDQSEWIRLALPSLPLAMLASLRLRRWRAQDRKRAVACLFGAALLVVPFAFVLADLVPALRDVVDDAGTRHPILPGDLWMPAPDAPAWMLTAARLLEWKLLITSVVACACAAWLHRATRSAAFLWIAGLAGIGVVVCGAALAGWETLPLAVRWSLASTLSLATIALGLLFDRSFRRDRAQPFYGLGFAAALFSAINYVDQNAPASLLGVAAKPTGPLWSLAIDGLLFVAGGLVAHFRGTPQLRSSAAAALFVGLALTLFGFGGLANNGSTLLEIELIAACIAFLVLGLALHRNSLVLPAAIALPIAVGAVSQKHVQGLWAWSAAVVLGGAVLVLLSFRRQRSN